MSASNLQVDPVTGELTVLPPQPPSMPGQQPSAPQMPVAYQQPLPQGMLPYGMGSGGVYGQMTIAQPYLNALNSRFGWSPSGVAVGRPLDNIGMFYMPPMSMPNVVTPKITG